MVWGNIVSCSPSRITSSNCPTRPPLSEKQKVKAASSNLTWLWKIVLHRWFIYQSIDKNNSTLLNYQGVIGKTMVPCIFSCTFPGSIHSNTVKSYTGSPSSPPAWIVLHDLHHLVHKILRRWHILIYIYINNIYLSPNVIYIYVYIFRLYPHPYHP